MTRKVMVPRETSQPTSRTVIASVNPSTKVVIVVCAIVAGLMSGYWYLAGFCVAGLVAVLLNRRLTGFLKLFCAAMLPTALIIFGLNVVAHVEEPIYWQWAFIAISQAGLDAAIVFTTRFLVIGVGVMIIMHISDLQRFCRDLEQRGVSPRATYVIQSTGLIMPQLVSRGAVIMDAQRARGIETDSNVLVRMRALVPSAAPLIISTLTGVAERAASLEARGMTASGPRTSLLHIENKVGDKIALWLAVLALVVFIGWKVWQLWAR